MRCIGSPGQSLRGAGLAVPMAIGAGLSRKFLPHGLAGHDRQIVPRAGRNCRPVAAIISEERRRTRSKFPQNREKFAWHAYCF
jgi:hypothetical protein